MSGLYSDKRWGIRQTMRSLENLCSFHYICTRITNFNKLYGRQPQYAPAPCKLTFDLFTLKVVSESHATWDISVPNLVFLGLSVLHIGSDVRDRQTDVRRASALNAPYPRGGGITNQIHIGRQGNSQSASQEISDQLRGII